MSIAQQPTDRISKEQKLNKNANLIQLKNITPTETIIKRLPVK